MLSPLQFLERFLRLTDLQENQLIKEKAIEILKIAALKVKLYREFRPSDLAASSLLVALSILKLGKRAILKESPQHKAEERQILEDFWSPSVVLYSSINYEELEKPIHKLKQAIMKRS